MPAGKLQCLSGFPLPWTWPSNLVSSLRLVLLWCWERWAAPSLTAVPSVSSLGPLSTGFTGAALSVPSFNYKWAHAQQEQPRSCWSLHIKRHRKLRPVLLWPRCSIQDYIRNWEYFCKKCFMFHLSPDVGLFFFCNLFTCSKGRTKSCAIPQCHAATTPAVAERALAPVPSTRRPSGRDLQDKSKMLIFFNCNIGHSEAAFRAVASHPKRIKQSKTMYLIQTVTAKRNSCIVLLQ